MKSTSDVLPAGDLRLAFVAIVALALAVGVIAARTFAATTPVPPPPGDIDSAPSRPAAPAAPLLGVPPAATNPTKPASPGVIGQDPLLADDDPAPSPNLPGKGALKQ